MDFGRIDCVLEDEIGLQGPIYETWIFFVVLIHLSRLIFLAVI